LVQELMGLFKCKVCGAGIPYKVTARTVRCRSCGSAYVRSPEVEVARAIVTYLVAPAPPPVEPAGTIIGIDPPDGSEIAVDTLFVISVDFRNDAIETFPYTCEWIGKGVVTGTIYFDYFSSASILPGAIVTFKTPYVTMPDENLEVTIIITSP